MDNIFVIQEGTCLVHVDGRWENILLNSSPFALQLFCRLLNSSVSDDMTSKMVAVKRKILIFSVCILHLNYYNFFWSSWLPTSPAPDGNRAGNYLPSLQHDLVVETALSIESQRFFHLWNGSLHFKNISLLKFLKIVIFFKFSFQWKYLLVVQNIYIKFVCVSLWNAKTDLRGIIVAQWKTILFELHTV